MECVVCLLDGNESKYRLIVGLIDTRHFPILYFPINEISVTAVDYGVTVAAWLNVERVEVGIKDKKKTKRSVTLYNDENVIMINYDVDYK